jgi:hypothetical protein
MVDLNEFCPCQSGKKYSDCCIFKRKLGEDEKSKRMFYSFVLKAREKASEEYCIHPNKSECTTEIIHAHNIQHNGILSQLAEDGHVFMPVSDIFTNKLQLIKAGITKKATVFTGFCGKHDKKVFSGIEDFPFSKTEEQLFLYAYKAFAFTYYKVRREIKLNDFLVDEFDFSNYVLFLYFKEQLHLSYEFIQHELDKFNTCILTKDFSKMKSFVGELGYEVNFAVSSAFGIKYDLMENEISHFPQDGKLSLIFFTVFPENGVTYYIFSYFDEEEKNYSGLIQQVKSIPIPLLLKYLNNLIILNAENLVISPRLLNHWSEAQKIDFENTIQDSIENSIKNIDKNNYFEMRSFNIFENI